MNDEAREEALRLAKEAGLIDYTPTPGDSDYFNIDRWASLIALARASQAQPEPPAGWEQDAKRYRWLRDLHMDEAVVTWNIGHDWVYLHFEQLDAAIDAAIAAAPSPITGEKE